MLVQPYLLKDLDKAVSMAEKSAQLAKVEKSGSPKFMMKYYLLKKV